MGIIHHSRVPVSHPIDITVGDLDLETLESLEGTALGNILLDLYADARRGSADPDDPGPSPSSHWSHGQHASHSSHAQHEQGW